jgi:DNA repair exonuclease SbcCD ATPase subunit
MDKDEEDMFEVLELVDRKEQVELWNHFQAERKKQIGDKVENLQDRLRESFEEEERLKRRSGNKQLAALRKDITSIQGKIKKLKVEDPDCRQLTAVTREQSKLKATIKRLKQDAQLPISVTRRPKYAVPEEECPVCLDKEQDTRVNPDGCRHLFCSECAARVSTCPMCRTPITKRVPL